MVAPDAARRDPAALLAFLGRQRVERLFLPFVALASLSREAAESGGLPGSLAEVVTAGERLRVDGAVRRAFAAGASAGGPRLDNQYGPTETHVATAHRLAGDPAGWPELPPIGRPVAGARAVVVDAAFRPVAPGTAGELLLGGACLSRGYSGARPSPPSASSPIRSPTSDRANRARACTAPATWPGTFRTAASTSSAGGTTR